MKIKLKNTPEQVELIKAMGSRNAIVAREAQEAAEAAQRETERLARETQDALDRAANEVKNAFNPRNWF